MNNNLNSTLVNVEPVSVGADSNGILFKYNPC